MSASETEGLLGGGSKNPVIFGVAGLGCVCCCCVLLPVLIYYALVNQIGNQAIDGFITLHDKWMEEYCDNNFTYEQLTNNVYWPGCGFVTPNKTLNGCGGDCFTDKFIGDILAYNAKGEKPAIVSYKSRKSPFMPDDQEITLRGWLLKSFEPRPNTTKGPRPRVVLQHGFTSNSNKYRQIVAAYMLRRLGFDVLVNNFRDHCYSGDSKERVVEWGDGYPYDLLGAWDYLVSDPEKRLGGPAPADKVGLFGISMGAFTTVNSFGLEGRVPGAWADSPPLSPEEVFQTGATEALEGMGLGSLAGVLLGPSWQKVENAALAKGVNLNDNIPVETLPKGPDTKRPFYLVGNERDTTVPLDNVKGVYSKAISMPAKYQAQIWVNDGVCQDADHCVDHLHYHDEYQYRLCTFWTAVFKLDAATCAAFKPK